MSTKPVYRIRIWKDGTQPPQADWRVAALDDEGNRVDLDQDSYPTIEAAKNAAERLWPGVQIDAPIGGSRS